MRLRFAELEEDKAILTPLSLRALAGHHVGRNHRIWKPLAYFLQVVPKSTLSLPVSQDANFVRFG
jgi:hypothetical protein